MDITPSSFSASPTPGQDDPRAAEVMLDYSKAREYRKPFEGPWFIAGAMLRGQQHVLYDDALAKLVAPTAPSYRVRISINRIRPKIKARLAKFFKSRPRPLVVPASTERRDILNARATEKALSYTWTRLHLEEKYKDARGWATIASKGFWWFYWDFTLMRRVQVTGPDGKVSQQPAPLGDLCVEVGSPFEVLVADPTKSRIGQQPWIIRTRLMNKEDVLRRYPQVGEDITGGDRLSSYADKLASLRPQQNAVGAGAAPTHVHEKDVMVIEHFTAPGGKYAKGRYSVVVANQTVKDVMELPYGMWEHADNPYPCVEFMDSLTAGQFWGPTQIEQLIDLQREYNFLRGLLAENARMMARPKIIVYKQHNLKDGAWTNQAGEIVELNWMPGLPDPKIIQPANVAADIWNLLAMISKEFDDLTQIYPAAEGKVGAASSGFQTNLLQEASDGVHAPDIREDELAIQEAAWKIRRLMKLGYDTPTMVSIFGANASPEVIEFSSDQIDEFAEVRIQAGSMLPDLKSAKAQMAKEMFQAGMFGNPQDPMVRRRALEMIDIGGVDVITEDERRDIDEAAHENQLLTSGAQMGPQGPVKPAQFFEDHPTHIVSHSNDLKSPEVQAASPQVFMAKIAHLITHYDWVNAPLAQGLRLQYGMQGLPIATPPPMPPPPLPPAEKRMAVTLSLKGDDLLNPMVQQVLGQEGLPIQPPMPGAVPPGHPGGPPAPTGAEGAPGGPHPPGQMGSAPTGHPEPSGGQSGKGPHPQVVVNVHPPGQPTGGPPHVNQAGSNAGPHPAPLVPQPPLPH